MNVELDPSGGFRLHLPNGHHVVIPHDIRGLAILHRILTDEAAEGPKKIGHTSAPIQFMIDEWMKADRKAREAETDAFIQSLEIEINL